MLADIHSNTRDHRIIPQAWKDAVIKILKRELPGTINSTRKSENDWRQTFPEAWAHERNEAFVNALQVSELEGRQIHGMDESGDVYAFFFNHKGIKLYGKINLLPDNTIILIYSSHIADPKKGDYL